MGEACSRLLALARQQIGEHRIGLLPLALHAQGSGQVAGQPRVVRRQLTGLAQLPLGARPVLALQRLPGLAAQQLQLRTARRLTTGGLRSPLTLLGRQAGDIARITRRRLRLVQPRQGAHGVFVARLQARRLQIILLGARQLLARHRHVTQAEQRQRLLGIAAGGLFIRLLGDVVIACVQRLTTALHQQPVLGGRQQLVPFTEDVGVLLFGDRLLEPVDRFLTTTLTRQGQAQVALEGGVLRVRGQGFAQVALGQRGCALLYQHADTQLTGAPGRITGEFLLPGQQLLHLRLVRVPGVAIKERLPGTDAGIADRLLAQVGVLKARSEVARLAFAGHALDHGQGLVVAFGTKQLLGKKLLQLGTARILLVQGVEVVDGGRQLIGQAAADAPVLQRQLQAWRFALAKGRLITRQRLFETPGGSQQADLLQGLLALPAVHFQQAQHLPVLRAVRSQAMQVGIQLPGAVDFAGAHRLADRGGERVEVVRLQQAQARQGVFHQALAVRGFTQANLLHQPFALFATVRGLGQQRQGYRAQAQQGCQFSHCAFSQPGTSLPLASNR
ncbi:hypothetical protein D3C81_946920 [compost metagenome]